MNPCTFSLDPDECAETSLQETWNCPHKAHSETDVCVFHMDPSERASRGITEEDVAERVHEKLVDGDRTDRRFVGAHFSTLPFDHHDIEGQTEYPVDLRHTTIPGGIDVRFGRFEEQVDLRHSTVGGLDAVNCDFEHGLLCTGTTFTGDVSLQEAIVGGDEADFTGVRFTGAVRTQKARFREDVLFTDAVFEAEAVFDTTRFYDKTVHHGEETSFAGAQFEGPVSFTKAVLERTVFDDATFRDDLDLTSAKADGDLRFENCTFEGDVVGPELTVNADTRFNDATFHGEAVFTGAQFDGGPDVFHKDLECTGTTFGDSANFDDCVSGESTFEQATFEDRAEFSRSKFTDDSTFTGVTFDAVADFDEVVFDGDTTFENTGFDSDAVFRGAEFHGSTDYLSEDVSFDEAIFDGAADFQNCLFAVASFSNTGFKGNASFVEAQFEELFLKIISYGEQTYLNFSRAKIDEGELTQPAEGWVRFDLTKATLGEVTINAEKEVDRRQMLDYIRFCDTNFEGFDFSSHTGYLDRNNWTLHTFDGETRGYDYEVEMTPGMIEKTYLEAKTSASAQGNNKAAGEFRVKRQKYARRKFYNITTDGSESLATRFRNGLRVAENAFLGVTCGYGLRLYRIAGMFLFLPLVFGFVFAFGGSAFAIDGPASTQLTSLSDMASSEGLARLGRTIYFSYITFLTIGYGGTIPAGTAARFTAAFLVYLNVVLSGLFLYALVKRSEV